MATHLKAMPGGPPRRDQGQPGATKTMGGTGRVDTTAEGRHGVPHVP